ncbi:CipA protein [Thelonectria olida]|uniref:CipA protein n=1 Tax=Thelonectria olida TaxID=1576542 RepID=A0A9P9ASE3_9HYPO|nr:CipA protein [Thelonectria olida]
MAKHYANDQPEGFVNRIKNVAVVGAGGQIGRVFAEHLLAAGNHTVTAITRKDSKSVLPEGVKAAPVDYNDEDSIVSALKGQDVLVITMSLSAPPDTQTKLVKAAAKAGVQYIMPNTYGINFLGSEALRKDLPVGNGIVERVAEVREQGLSAIALVPSFWYEYSLSFGDSTFGFNLKGRKLTFYDDGNLAINVSTWPQCGRAIAALLSLKIMPDSEDDDSVTISSFRERPLFINSFRVSQRDILNSVLKTTGTTEADWEIAHQSTEDRFKEGGEELAQGNQLGFYKAMYARAFYPSGDANFEDDNQLLGLPSESLDEATLEAIEMSKRL